MKTNHRDRGGAGGRGREHGLAISERPLRQRAGAGAAVGSHRRPRLLASWTARNLSLGRRGCIGVAVDSSSDPWFVQLLMGIEEELSARDTGLMLSSLELRGQYDPTLVFSWIRDRRVDGLVSRSRSAASARC